MGRKIKYFDFLFEGNTSDLINEELIMTSKKNMLTNRSPRRIHRNKGGRKKGSKPLEQLEKITKKNKDFFSKFNK